MAGSPVGSLELRVDPAGLIAEFLFTPDPRGVEWSLGKAMRLLLDARVMGVAQKRVEEILFKFARAAGPVTEVVAQGLPPEQPVQEEPEWVDLPVPPEAEPYRDAALRAAPAPDVYQVRIEKVSVERTVLKPGLLPFLPKKHERIVEIERREVKEAVVLDTRVLGTGFARKGQRLSIVSTARPGRPGKSVYGKALMPEGPEDTKFHCGSGALRAKNEITAEVDGFVRWGLRWVDVLPFGLHSWEVSRSSDGTSFFLDFTPGESRLPLPDPEEILAAAADKGADPTTLVAGEEILAALRSAVAEAEPLYSFSISSNRDASVEVVVSPDKMRATLTVRKGRGRGRPLELSVLGAAISRARIVGMDASRVKADLLAFYKGSETDLQNYLLAQGKAPSRGKDREIAWSVAFLPEEQAEPLRKAVSLHPSLSATAPSLPDFPLEQGRGLAFVKAGQAIGSLTAADPGQPGVSVLGQALPGLPGSDPRVRLYENVSLVRGSFLSEVEGLVFQGELDGEIFLRVLPYRDCRIEAVVAPDASEAFLTLHREEGLGTRLTLGDALSALDAQGVVFGVDREAVSDAVLAARSGQAVERLVAARSKAPVAAGGVRTEWKVRRATGAAVTIRDDGRADYKNQDRSTLVEEGQSIAELVRYGGEGEAGRDVRGNAVKPTSDLPSDVPPQWDASLREERSQEGNVLLVAARTGELYFENNRLYIVQSKQIAGDVGPAVGNIRFPGNVQISGSVLGGYTVFSGGDLNISGSVEASLLAADGAIRIGEGIKGGRKATLRARKTLEASFSEQALLLAVEDITLKGACLLSSVKTNGRLVLGGDKGILIGGRVRARKGVEVQSLGSESGIKTEISFGQDYLLADQVETEEKEIARLKVLILQSDKRMKDLERGGLDLDEVRQDKTKLMRLLEKRSLRVFDLRERFEEHHESDVVVRGVVHPGVVLESHSRYLEVKSRRERVAFSFDVQLGRIVERSLI